MWDIIWLKILMPIPIKYVIICKLGIKDIVDKNTAVIHLLTT